MFSWFGKVSYVPYSKVSDFAVHLKDGRLMGSTCKGCGFASFPPRADCPECMAGEFEFTERDGKGTQAHVHLGRADQSPCAVAEQDAEGRAQRG